MKVMDIVADVEDTFDIAVPLNILPDVRTIGDFVGQIQKLIDQISWHHFREKRRKIQIDCDWTESTRDDFFKLIRFFYYRLKSS